MRLDLETSRTSYVSPMRSAADIARHLLGPSSGGPVQLMGLDGEVLWSGHLAQVKDRKVSQVAIESAQVIVLAHRGETNASLGGAAWASSGKRIYAPREIASYVPAMTTDATASATAPDEQDLVRRLADAQVEVAVRTDEFAALDPFSDSSIYRPAQAKLSEAIHLRDRIGRELYQLRRVTIGG